MKDHSKYSSPVPLLVFFSSLSCLSYEIALTRIFSITLWHHFAFMVVSTAMLGIGASGALLARSPKLKDERLIPAYCLFLAAGIPVSYILSNHIPFDPARLSWDRLQLLYIGLYSVVLCVPFFFFGMAVSTAYSALSRRAAIIYASDLLGAGAGAVVMFLLLTIGRPENAVFIMSFSIALMLVFGRGLKVRLASLFIIAVDASLLLFHPQISDPRLSPYKPLSLALKHPGAEHIKTAYSPCSRIDVFKSPAVRFAPGLSFKWLAPLPDQTGISLDGGDVSAVTNDEDGRRLEFLRYLPSALPYHIASKNDILILEPKAGLAVLTAARHGAKNIYKVDSNPMVIKTVRELTENSSMPVYDDMTWSGLGRTWLSSRDALFDIIDISMTGSMPSGSFGFAEDYRFTVEAFTDYLRHLKHDGILSLTMHIIPPPRTELRILAAIAEAAENAGIKDFQRHVAAIRSWGTLTLVVKKSALSHDDIERIRQFSKNMRFDIVYCPGVKEEESNRFIKVPGNEYYHAFQSMMDPELRRRFIKDYLFDVRPVHDENPFFHYFLKLKNIRETYRVMGGKWEYFIEEGYLLPVLLVQAALLSAVFILLPAIGAKRASGLRINRGVVLPLSYFACLGIGYLFIEVTLIQKMILALENPPYAASIVIASVLIASGTGSLLSLRSGLLKRPVTLLVLAAVITAYSMLLPSAGDLIGRHSLPLKAALAFCMIMPLGVLMGIPFPTGMSHLGRTDPALIPWAWAVNGCFSVLSPIIAVMLALSLGYKTVLLIAAALYFAAYLILKRISSVSG